MPRKTAHPYVSWRNGRPRFTPSPQLRAQGHASKDLRHPDGRWLSKGECLDWSETFLASLRQQPAGPRGRPKAEAPRRLTVGKLVELWMRLSPRWAAGPPTGAAGRGRRKPLSPATKRDYRQKLGVIENDFWDVWTFPAELVKRPNIQGLYDEIEQAHGLATARGAIVVLGSVFKWGLNRGHIRMAANPCSGIDKAMPVPRVRFGTRREMFAMVAAADALGLPQIGDAHVLGLWTGQRQADRLSLSHHGRLGRRRIFKQQKTGAIVHVLEAPELEARLAKAMERRAAAGIIDPHVILNEATWRPYNSHTYRHDYARVRRAAIGGVKQAAGAAFLVEPCPSLASFQDRDLRDTAVTWLALAQATVPEIAAVTGHSTQNVYAILKHYLASHPELADSAIRKMIAWYDALGETEIG